MRKNIKSFLQKQSAEDNVFTELRKKSKHNRIFSNHEKLGERIPSQVDVYRDINLGRTIVEVKAPDQVGLLLTYLLIPYPNADLILNLLELLPNKV